MLSCFAQCRTSLRPPPSSGSRLARRPRTVPAQSRARGATPGGRRGRPPPLCSPAPRAPARMRLLLQAPGGGLAHAGFKWRHPSKVSGGQASPRSPPQAKRTLGSGRSRRRRASRLAEGASRPLRRARPCVTVVLAQARLCCRNDVIHGRAAAAGASWLPANVCCGLLPPRTFQFSGTATSEAVRRAVDGATGRCNARVPGTWFIVWQRNTVWNGHSWYYASHTQDLLVLLRTKALPNSSAQPHTDRPPQQRTAKLGNRRRWRTNGPSRPSGMTGTDTRRVEALRCRRGCAGCPPAPS